MSTLGRAPDETPWLQRDGERGLVGPAPRAGGTDPRSAFCVALPSTEIRVPGRRPCAADSRAGTLPSRITYTRISCWPWLSICETGSNPASVPKCRAACRTRRRTCRGRQVVAQSAACKCELRHSTASSSWPTARHQSDLAIAASRAGAPRRVGLLAREGVGEDLPGLPARACAGVKCGRSRRGGRGIRSRCRRGRSGSMAQGPRARGLRRWRAARGCARRRTSGGRCRRGRRQLPSDADASALG